MTIESDFSTTSAFSAEAHGSSSDQGSSDLDTDRLLHFTKLPLEKFKTDLLHNALLEFQKLSTNIPLSDIALRSFTPVLDKKEESGKSNANFLTFLRQIEYIRKFLQALNLFPSDIVANITPSLSEQCENLLGAILSEYMTRYAPGVASDSRSQTLQYIEDVIMPVVQLSNDCLEMNSIAFDCFNSRIISRRSCLSSTFSKLCAFLISPEGLSLEKPHFLRILALAQKLSNFMDRLKGKMESSEEAVHDSRVNDIENQLCSNVSIVLSSANGRSFVKFWCDYLLSTRAKKVPLCLDQISNIDSSSETTEIYVILTSYMKDNDNWFWRTNVGQVITPILIQSLRNDLLSTDKNKAETKKRAAFILKGITTMYTLGNPMFDPDVPEVSSITLNNMAIKDKKMYAKFWGYFFDLYDILNESQLHIVQPILSKLNIFQEHSDNDSVFIWLPVLLTKMVTHDNRSIVKEGFERFLETGQCFKLQKSDAYRLIAQEFLDNYVMKIIKEHVGWVLNDPAEFFKNIPAFGTFLNQLHSTSDCKLPHFKSAIKILTFLTSSGKCMSSHTVFFLVSSVEAALGQYETSPVIDIGGFTEDVRGPVDSLLTLLGHLVSTNVTTVSRYFREQLEKSSVDIFLVLAPYLSLSYNEDGSNIYPDPDFLQVFVKLLKFLGSLSEKVLYAYDTQGKVAKIIEVYIGLRNGSLKSLLAGDLYVLAKKNFTFKSVVGLFRFLRIGCEAGKFKSQDFNSAVENFAEKTSNDWLPGSVQGIREYYENCDKPDPQNSPHFPDMTGKRVLCELVKTTPMTGEIFLSCVRNLEIMSSFPRKEALSDDTYPSLSEVVMKDPAKLFLARKLLLLKFKNQELNDIEKLHRLEDFCIAEEQEISPIFVEVNEEYFGITGNNVMADFYQSKFMMYAQILSNCSEIQEALRLQMLNGILDTLEKCDPRGASAGLRLAKSIMKYVVGEQEEILGVLTRIASLSWSLVFEQRKNENFWLGLQAFVEFICDPIFVITGDLNKYADLIFEEGEMVWGLPFVYVQQLVKVNFLIHQMENVHQLLIDAALAGAPLPKNHRMSFSLWDYMRNEDEPEEDDLEHFGSDCKARVLACEKLHANIQSLMSKEDSKHEGEKLLKKIVTTLLDKNDEESVTRKRYFGGSTTHRLKQRIFQGLLTLQPYFNVDVSEFVLKKTLFSLSTDSPQPSVRYLGEWLVVRILEEHPLLHNCFFGCQNECIQRRVGFGAFFATICLHVSKRLPLIEFCDKALQALTTLTLSQHVTVRIYAQVAFQRIYENAKESNFLSLVEKYAPVLQALKSALVFVSGNCSKLLENISNDFYINSFNSHDHYCPEVIFSLLPRLSGMIKDECILHASTIRTLFGSHDEMQLEAAEILKHIYQDNEKSAWHLKTVVADGRELGEEIATENCLRSKPVRSDVEEEEMNYQKKINPWKLLSVSNEIEDYNDFSSKKRCVNEDGLIVVASLLENLPNLGGLCRTCEIFGVQKYVVNTLKVINDLQFQNLSVSAQNWVNILEVPTRDLESFLLTYSAKGYSILGIEQANESRSLTNFSFPKKAVLLLGNEKLGIPTELLRLVDQCIEIPQVGIIRSLNVHVTGALCIWQYAAQHIL